LKGMTLIDAGNAQSLALKDDGTVWSWGSSNRYGELGNRDKNITIPEKVEGIENIVDISAGTMHSALLTGDGTVMEWGWDYSGEIG